MEARAFDGDRVTALKIFQTWKAALANELQAEPSELLEGIAIRLRQAGWESPTLDLPEVPTDQWRGRQFIGRAVEYERLYSAWEATLRRTPQHILVLGDSGVGKSTLLERLVTAAGLEGAIITRAQCYELERDIPYATLSSLVEGLLNCTGALGTPPEWLAELSYTVPAVRRRFPGIPKERATEGETARVRLTDSLAQLLSSIEEDRPIVILLDDIHLADDASLAVLHLLMRRMRSERIIILMAARSGALGHSPQAVRLRENSTDLGLTDLELGPLSTEESHALLSNLLALGQAPPATLTQRALVRAAGGYPMVLEYLIGDWQTNGDRCLALSLDAMIEDLRPISPPLAKYHVILLRIIRGLPPSIRQVLNMATVLGPRLNEIELYRLADVSVGQTMMALGRLTDLRILRDGGKGLEFGNELIRGEAYLAMPSTVRRTLHKGMSDYLLSRDGSGVTIPGLEIAWHLIRAGHGVEATAYLLKGAAEAIRRGAPYEAQRGLETAMGHLDGDSKSEALVLLAESLCEQGKWHAALQILEDCGDLEPRLNDNATVLAMEAKRRLGIVAPDSGDRVFVETLAIAESTHSSRLKVRAATSLAYLLVHKDEQDLDRRVVNVLKSLDQAALSGNDHAHLAIANAIMWCHQGQHRSAKAELRTAVTRMEGQGITNSAFVLLHIAIANVSSITGEYAESYASNLTAFNLANAIGNDHLCIIALTNLTMCCCRLGDYRPATAWCYRAHSRNAQMPTEAITKGAYHGALAHALLGEHDEARTLADSLEGALRSHRDMFARQTYALYLADIYATLGHRDIALKFARRATEDDIQELQSPNNAGMYSRWLAAMIACGQRPKAHRVMIENLLEKLDRLDRADQTEVLCASVWLDKQEGSTKQDRELDLKKELAELPEGVCKLLQVTGFLG
jgi:tetratricopeptide (TPR) repeat protein